MSGDMSPPESTTALIVDAGPSGLAAALSLVHHGIRDIVLADVVIYRWEVDMLFGQIVRARYVIGQTAPDRV